MARKSRSRMGANGPSTTAVKYMGPTRVQNKEGMNTTFITEVGATGLLSADSFGVLNGSTRTSDVITSINWTPLAANYQEYRILGMRFNYVPYYSNGYTVVNSAAPSGAICTFHSTSSPLVTSVNVAVNNSTYKIWNAAERISTEWKMNGVDEAGFISTGSASDVGAIQWYLDGGTPSVNCGRFYVTWVIQFKGRR